LGKGLAVIGIIAVVAIAVVIFMPGFFTGLFNSAYDHEGKTVDSEAKDFFSGPTDWWVVPESSSANPSLYPSNNVSNAPVAVKTHIVSYEFRTYSPVGGAVDANHKNVQIHIMVFNTTGNAVTAYNSLVDATWEKYGKFQEASKKAFGADYTLYVFQDLNVVGYAKVVPAEGLSEKDQINPFMVSIEKKIHDAGKKA